MLSSTSWLFTMISLYLSSKTTVTYFLCDVDVSGLGEVVLAFRLEEVPVEIDYHLFVALHLGVGRVVVVDVHLGHFTPFGVDGVTAGVVISAAIRTHE